MNNKEVCSGRSTVYDKPFSYTADDEMFLKYFFMPDYEDDNFKLYRFNVLTAQYLSELGTVIKIKNAPDTLNQRKLIEYLFTSGKCGLGYFNGNFIAVRGNIFSDDGKFNDYDEATHFQCVSRKFSGEMRTIGKDIVVMRCDDYSLGFLRKLSALIIMQIEAEITLRNSLLNMRVLQGLTANSQDDVKEVRKYLDDVKLGKLAVIYGDDWADREIKPVNTGTTSANESLSKAIEALQYIKGTIRHEMGLQSNFNMKREALNSSETVMNEQGLRPYIDDVIKNIDEAIDEANELFNLEMSVELSGAWKMRDTMALSIENEMVKNENEIDGEIVQQGGDDNEIKKD